MKPWNFLAALALIVGPLWTGVAMADEYGRNVHLGPRPLFLVDQMKASPLKDRLASCAAGPFKRTNFSIGHRGAPLQFPEHTRESYIAAARMGAGILECDVTFTKDKELVCRHSQCDLHTTTNILETPLAAQCSVPFTPAANGQPSNAKCCTSDITLAEFRTLRGKMDAANKKATTVAEYLNGTADWRTDLYASTGTLMTHRESIELFRNLGVGFTPELKSPSVTMPFDGDFTQKAYASKLIEEYRAAGIDPKTVFAQSFNLDDVKHWIASAPEFGEQAVYLDGRYSDKSFDPTRPETWKPGMEDLVRDGVKFLAPPMWFLVALDAEKRIVPSIYAKAAKKAGLKLITWTLERSGTLGAGGGWYFQSIKDATDNDGVAMELLDVLAKDVGIAGIFSDWPATVTYYANCMKLDG